MRSDMPWVIGVVKRSGPDLETIFRCLQGVGPPAHYRIGSSDRVVLDQIG